ARGFDRPLDRAFVTVQRQLGRKRFVKVADDLGVQILWTVDSNDVYRAVWQIPLSAPAGRYRFLVTANHYRLRSRVFRVVPSRGLMLGVVRLRGGRIGVALGYPPPMLASELDADLTFHPARASGGLVTFRVG